MSVEVSTQQCGPLRGWVWILFLSHFFFWWICRFCREKIAREHRVRTLSVFRAKNCNRKKKGPPKPEKKLNLNDRQILTICGQVAESGQETASERGEAASCSGIETRASGTNFFWTHISIYMYAFCLVAILKVESVYGVCEWVSVCVCVSMCVRACVHACTCLWVHSFVQSMSNNDMCACVCMYAHTHTHTHTYIHVYVHTHIYIYKYDTNTHYLDS